MPPISKNSTYQQGVGAKFHLFNSLFLNLPFQHVLRTGTLLPLLQQHCADGIEKGLSAIEIVRTFFEKHVPHSSAEEQFDLLFNIIQYVERQVALFDSVEDSVFEQVNDLNGKGTIPALLLRATYDQKLDKLKEKLEQFSLRTVLTAHPTQFYPGHVLGILTDLENAIRSNDFGEVNLLLQQLGKTGFINQQKPTPYDEALSLTWYLENVFYKAIPQIIDSLAKGLGVALSDWKNNRLVVIGFWPGGDRDGNPFVTTEITLKVAARLRESILKCYYREAHQLRRRLTFQGVHPMIISIEQKIYDLVFKKENSYATSAELLAELGHARSMLVSEHNGLFLDLLDRFILKIKVFGFHFASLDIRQDSRKHDAVWNEILNALSKNRQSITANEFHLLDEKAKINYLLSLQANLIFLDFEDHLANETIQSILAIKKIQLQNGVEGCHRYVISNCQSALHIIEVYVLAKLLMGEKEDLQLDIVPLFETIGDLAHCANIMQDVYSIEEYRHHLSLRNNHQTVMLGFSDGTKDGGYLRANWSIFRAKESLTAVSRQFGIKALFFDGRGGPPARGGGNTHDFYASLGETIEQEEVQVTVQGQTISSNFGKPASCQYNLEQLISAGVECEVLGRNTSMTEAEKTLLDELADAGYQAYLTLRQHEKFVPYLEKVTPLPFFGDTNIGSRPVKRSGGAGLQFEDLRAIPFVGSWAMMKQNIPGFYGVGSALKALREKNKELELRKLYQNSLFFRTLLGNSMMSLSKTYYQATTYLRDDPEFGAFWKKMFDEYELSTSQSLEIAEMSELMANNPNIRQSVYLREQVVLPLIAIQQASLMNLRNLTVENKAHELRYRKLIIRCMFGIINAARNSA
jgi:phosphoenolpyruvate carboxylase